MNYSKIIWALPFVTVLAVAAWMTAYPTKAEIAPPLIDGNVVITNGKMDAGPEFERIYTATLPGDRTLEIRLHTNYHYGWHTPQRENRFSKLIQSNGYYILFDPRRVADKVIDPSITPAVEDLSARILATDAAWWADKPKEFTDAGGTTWVRK